MKYLVLILFFVLGLTPSTAQRFMVIDNDTLPYQLQIIVTKKGDTLFKDPCPYFFKMGDSIVNRMNSQCEPDGLWIEDQKFDVYYRNYDNGKLHGISKRIQKDTLKPFTYLSNYSNDTLHEFRLIDYDNNLIVKWIYKFYKDSIILFDTSWHANGALHEIKKYCFPPKYPISASKWDYYKYAIGTSTGWYQSGQISYQRYNDNPKEKISISYAENGKPITMTFYRPDGYMETVLGFNDNGSISSIEKYINTKQGPNTRHGEWKYYDENGILIRTEIYNKGKLQ